MTHLTAAEALGTPGALDLKDEERQPCEIWTRVMGYHRPVSSFNRGKQGEFADRVAFREPARSVG
ncbi:anaerobic ribonucleoside-triphosphate reductase [Rhodospira trueperi]|uniref:Anaerobic ribonucleoside-triphosphate reductase n=1 Tax=Rhodospira trueperi TaxID=69960 RepID=A0A1G7EYT0_9PROT|nr:anaerobic ribonucleoside-triphosphate reductase [Rhodospira trueperi]SDE68626.1 Anaerobic ribonucleoside-triphosphate reductase [Rhodospira trueperi]